MKTDLARIAERIEHVDRRVLWIALNGLALALLFFIAIRYNYLHPDNIGRLMFSTPDTKQYRAVADWLFGRTGPAPFATTLRPFLYPLLLGGVWQVTGNPYVFWAVQAALWLAAINLTALAVLRLTNRKVLYTVAFCIMSVNISAIAMTFFALTETTVVFLWSIWLFVFSGTELGQPRPRQLFLLTFLLALLTVTKPVYEIHLVFFLAYALFRYWSRRANVLALAVAVLPVVVQILANVSLNGIVGVSNITDYTLKWYLLPQVVAARSGLSLDETRAAVKDYDTIRAARALLEDPASLSLSFVRNVTQNLTSPSDYISFYPKPYVFTQLTNIAYLVIQVALLPVLLYVFWTKKGARAPAFGLLFLFSLLVIFTSGISFDEGDRLVIGALPLWIALYASLPAAFLEPSRVQALPSRLAI